MSKIIMYSAAYIFRSYLYTRPWKTGRGSLLNVFLVTFLTVFGGLFGFFVITLLLGWAFIP